MSRAILIVIVCTGCGASPIELALVTPIELAQTGFIYDAPGGELRVFSAEGTTTFPTGGRPTARAALRWSDTVTTVELELAPGRYWAEALYTEQRRGSPNVLPLLRQFTITPFRVAAGHFVSVDLYENNTTAFDFDRDGVENLDELITATDAEDAASFDCRVSRCRPVLVATDLPEPIGAAIHGDLLLTLVDPDDDASPGAIWRTALSDGATAIWRHTGKQPFQFQVTADHALWLDRGPVGPLPPATYVGWTGLEQPAPTVDLSEESITAFTANSQLVFYAFAGTDKPRGLYAARLDDGTPGTTPLVSGVPCEGPGMISDEEAIYGIAGVPCGAILYRVPVDSQDSHDCPTLAYVSFGARHLTQNATHLYWLDGTRVLRVAKQGGPTEVVATDGTSDDLLDLHVDGEVVYWVRRARLGPNRVLVAASAGTPPVELFVDPTGELHLLAADAAAFYWRSTAGELWRIGKLSGPAP